MVSRFARAPLDAIVGPRTDVWGTASAASEAAAASVRLDSLRLIAPRPAPEWARGRAQGGVHDAARLFGPRLGVARRAAPSPAALRTACRPRATHEDAQKAQGEKPSRSLAWLPGVGDDRDYPPLGLLKHPRKCLGLGPGRRSASGAGEPLRTRLGAAHEFGKVHENPEISNVPEHGSSGDRSSCPTTCETHDSPCLRPKHGSF